MMKGRGGGGWGGMKGGKGVPGAKGGKGARMMPYYTNEDNAAKDEMEHLVKSAQRANREWSESWAKYCEECGKGVADPAKHSLAFLTSAIAVLGLPSGDIEKGKLVVRIKSYQRFSPAAREIWTQLCDKKEGERAHYDPHHYDEDFLATALDEIKKECPEEPSTAACEGGRRPKNPYTMPLQDRQNDSQSVGDLKELQKSSTVAADAWVEFCELNSDGTLDPKRFDDRFLQRAMTYMKRAVYLVNSIKDMTRQGGHPMWKRFCDEHGEGMYDPANYDVKFLERASEYTRHHLNRAKGGRGGGNSSGQSRGRGGGSGGRGRGDEIASADSVNEFKDFQRKNPGFTDWWRTHADEFGDGVYNPASHSDAFLRNAIDSFCDGQ